LKRHSIIALVIAREPFKNEDKQPASGFPEAFSNLDTLTRLWLNNLDFWVSRSNLLLEPLA